MRARASRPGPWAAPVRCMGFMGTSSEVFRGSNKLGGGKMHSFWRQGVDRRRRFDLNAGLERNEGVIYNGHAPPRGLWESSRPSLSDVTVTRKGPPPTGTGVVMPSKNRPGSIFGFFPVVTDFCCLPPSFSREAQARSALDPKVRINFVIRVWLISHSQANSLPKT